MGFFLVVVHKLLLVPQPGIIPRALHWKVDSWSLDHLGSHYALLPTKFYYNYTAKYYVSNNKSLRDSECLQTQTHEHTHVDQR